MRIVALTGAGISAESGVPTFRGAAGLWRDYRPEELATLSAFKRDPKLVWEFYAWRRELVSSCEPNDAHDLLAEIERDEHNLSVVTQNVDGLHQKAGSKDVLELHGSLWKLKCMDCDHKWDSHQVPLPELPPKCPACDGLARPDVVWFGEALDAGVLRQATDTVQQAETMLVIGTSALVYPAAGLPAIAQTTGARIVEINPQETPLSEMAAEIYREPATSGLRRWWTEFNNRD